MITQKLLLKTKHPISLKWTVVSHGWVELAPWQWNEEQQELSRLESINQIPITVKLRQLSAKSFDITCQSKAKLNEAAKAIVVDRVSRWLSVNWDPKGALGIVKNISPEHFNVIKKGGGRFLRSSTFYEDFVKTICTINTSWTGTKNMALSLVNKIGQGHFPTPQIIMKKGKAHLLKHTSLGYRAQVLCQTTKQMLKDGILQEDGSALEQKITYDYLRTLYGIGPYAAAHGCFLLNDFNNIPIDSTVKKFCEDNYGFCRENEINDYFNIWGKYKYLGYKLIRMAIF